MPTQSTSSRRGRPPASDSAETRQRILDVARAAFADLGWEVTTNKHVATKAGITSAALYHYFDSKLQMYLAVYDDVHELVTNRFTSAMQEADTFAEQFAAVLEAAHAMNGADPSLARFLASVRIDLRRHEELARAWNERPRTGDEIVDKLIAKGVRTGEISRAHRARASLYVRLVLVGLNDAVSGDDRAHRVATDGILAALDGRLFGPPHEPTPRR